MRLEELLVARRLVSIGDIDAAIERQRAQGGRLGENLVALNILSAEDLARIAGAAPRAPTTIEATGLAGRALVELALKYLLVAVEASVDARSAYQRAVVDQWLLHLCRHGSALHVGPRCTPRFRQTADSLP